MENPDGYVTGNGAKLLALVRSLADYGHHVQPFLSGVRGWTLGEGKDHAVMPSAAELADEVGGKALAIGDADVEAAAAGSKGSAVAWKLPSGCGIAKGSYSLELNAGTNIFLYFKMEGGAEVASAVVNGVAAEKRASDGVSPTFERRPDGRWRVTVPNIAAHELGDVHVVKVTTSAGVTATASVSALSYVNGLLSSAAYRDDQPARLAVAALYRYWDAASAYIGG